MSKPKLSHGLMLMSLIGCTAFLQGCSTTQPVAVTCPQLPAVPKALMEPAANSALLDKVLTPEPASKMPSK